MHNVTILLFDGTVIEMKNVVLRDALWRAWTAYGEDIMSMSIEPNNRTARLRRSYDAFGNVVRE